MKRKIRIFQAIYKHELVFDIIPNVEMNFKMSDGCDIKPEHSSSDENYRTKIYNLLHIKIFSSIYSIKNFILL